MTREIYFTAVDDIIAIKNKIKTVARRRVCPPSSAFNFDPGDIVDCFSPDENLPIAKIRIVSIRNEKLSAVVEEDIAKEGFNMTIKEFIFMFKRRLLISEEDTITRFEFEYV